MKMFTDVRMDGLTEGLTDGQMPGSSLYPPNLFKK